MPFGVPFCPRGIIWYFANFPDIADNETSAERAIIVGNRYFCHGSTSICFAPVQTAESSLARADFHVFKKQTQESSELRHKTKKDRYRTHHAIQTYCATKQKLHAKHLHLLAAE